MKLLAFTDIHENTKLLARIKRIFLISRIELTLLLLLVVDMVVKPGA